MRQNCEPLAVIHMGGLWIVCLWCLLKEVTRQQICQGNVDTWQSINGITFPSIPDLGFKVDELISSPGRLQDNHNRKDNNNDKVKRKTQKILKEKQHSLPWDQTVVLPLWWQFSSKYILACYKYIASELIGGGSSSQNCMILFGYRTSRDVWEKLLNRQAPCSSLTSHGLLSHFYTTEPRLKSLSPPSKMCAQRCGRYRPLPKQDPRQTDIQPRRVSLHLSLPYSSATRLFLCLQGASLSLHWLGLSWTHAGLCLGVSALASSVDQGDVNSPFGPNTATQGTQPPRRPVGDTHLLLQASAPLQLDSLV